MLTSDSNVAMQNTYLHAPVDGWRLYKFEEAVFRRVAYSQAHITSRSRAALGENGSWETMRVSGPTGYTRLKKEKIVLPTEIDWFGTRIVSTLANERWSTRRRRLPSDSAAFRYGWTPQLPDTVGIWLHARASKENYFGCVRRTERYDHVDYQRAAGCVRTSSCGNVIKERSYIYYGSMAASLDLRRHRSSHFFEMDSGSTSARMRVKNDATTRLMLGLARQPDYRAGYAVSRPWVRHQGRV